MALQPQNASISVMIDYPEAKRAGIMPSPQIWKSSWSQVALRVKHETFFQAWCLTTDFTH